MLNFVFDNDAFENLVRHPNIESLKTSIQNRDVAGGIKCYYTSTNFTEMIAGVSRDNYPRLSEIAIGSWKIASTGDNVNLLLSTGTIFKNELDEADLDEMKEEGRRLFNNLRLFIAVPDYDAFLKFAAPSRRRWMTTKLDGWFYCQKAFERARFIWKDRGVKYFSYENRQVFHSRLWKDAVHLSPRMTSLPSDVQRFEEECPGMFWWAEALRSYLGSIFRCSRKPRKGDWLDIMRVPYLALCDYLVTDDKSLIALVDDSENPNLQGRLIRSASFVSELTSPTLGKRRPQSADKWLSASDFPTLGNALSEQVAK